MAHVIAIQEIHRRPLQDDRYVWNKVHFLLVDDGVLAMAD